jgi:transcriptional regulator with XRE-family HTH domain
MDIGSIIGKRIRYYRKNVGLTQEQLAEKAGLHNTYIGQIERGEKNATIKIIYKIAVALDVPLDVLFSDIMSVPEKSAPDPATECYSAISKLEIDRQKKMLTIIKDIIGYSR